MAVIKGIRANVIVDGQPLEEFNAGDNVDKGVDMTRTSTPTPTLITRRRAQTMTTRNTLMTKRLYKIWWILAVAHILVPVVESQNIFPRFLMPILRSKLACHDLGCKDTNLGLFESYSLLMGYVWSHKPGRRRGTDWIASRLKRKLWQAVSVQRDRN